MGYGVGYIAGLIALILFLIFVWPGGETDNLYGLDTSEYEHKEWSGLSALFGMQSLLYLCFYLR